MPYCAHCGNPVTAVSWSPCPRCGKATNGASAPASAASGSKAAVIVIGIVAGGLFLVAVLGIVAAIAVPNFLTATQRAKQKRTMADIRSIATAAEAFAVDKNTFPSMPEELAPTYIRELPPNDGWGRGLEYECLPDERGPCSGGYVIGSAGKDGLFDRGSARAALEQPYGATTSFDCDIIYSNGSFIDYPEGVQR